MEDLGSRVCTGSHVEVLLSLGEKSKLIFEGDCYGSGGDCFNSP